MPLSTDSQTNGSGYFDLRKRQHVRQDSFSPGWTRTSPSQTSRPVAPPISPTSSKGSWSSLFNPSHVRQLMTGTQGIVSSRSIQIYHFMTGSQTRSAISVPGEGKGYLSSALKGTKICDSPPVTPPAAMSWSDTPNTVTTIVSFSSAEHQARRPTFSQVLASRPTSTERKRVVLYSYKEERLELWCI